MRIFSIKKLLKRSSLSIILLFCTFFCGKVNAAASNQVLLDFSNVSNPWNLADKINFTLPSEVENKKFHINMNASGSELIVWIYDKEVTIDGDNLLSEEQNYYLKVYKYDSNSNSFVYDHDWTHYNKTSVEKFQLLYSNYTIVEKTKFPNWSYQYNKAKQNLDSISVYKTRIEYLIKKLKDFNYKFVITIDLQNRIHPIISLEDSEFFYNKIYKKFNQKVIYLNNANTELQNDFYALEDLTTEFVDSYVQDISDNFDKFNRGGCYGSQCGSLPGGSYNAGIFDNLDENIVLYSSFSDTFTFQNQLDPIVIDSIPFVSVFPTFSTFYNYFELAPDVNFKRTILYHDTVKTARFYFDIPNNSNVFLEYHAFSSDGSNIYAPIYHFLDEETGEWEYDNPFGELTFSKSFRSKIFDNVSAKPTLKNGYIEFDVSFGTSDILVDMKSDYITKIELEYYNRPEEDKFVSEKDLDGYHCYDIKAKNLEEFNLNFKIPRDTKDFLDYRLFAINQTDTFNRPYIAIYNALTMQYDKSTIFEDNPQKLYTQIIPGSHFSFQHYHTKGYINVDTTSAKSDLRLCVNSTDYITDYNYKLHEKTDEEKSVGDWLSDVNKFLSDSTLYIKEFFGIIAYFFNSLNPIIKTAIIGLFIVFVMSCIILIARK